MPILCRFVRSWPLTRLAPGRLSGRVFGRRCNGYHDHRVDIVKPGVVKRTSRYRFVGLFRVPRTVQNFPVVMNDPRIMPRPRDALYPGHHFPDGSVRRQHR